RLPRLPRKPSPRLGLTPSPDPRRCETPEGLPVPPQPKPHKPPHTDPPLAACRPYGRARKGRTPQVNECRPGQRSRTPALDGGQGEGVTCALGKVVRSTRATPTPHASALPDRRGDAGGGPHRSERDT